MSIPQTHPHHKPETSPNGPSGSFSYAARMLSAIRWIIELVFIGAVIIILIVAIAAAA